MFCALNCKQAKIYVLMYIANIDRNEIRMNAQNLNVGSTSFASARCSTINFAFSANIVLNRHFALTHLKVAYRYIPLCFIIALLVVFLYSFRTVMETVKSNHVSRFEMDLKCIIFLLQS